MERHFSDKLHIYQCLIQLAIFDKFIQDMKRNFKEMQKIRKDLQRERNNLSRIKDEVNEIENREIGNEKDKFAFKKS